MQSRDKWERSASLHEPITTKRFAVRRGQSDAPWFGKNHHRQLDEPPENGRIRRRAVQLIILRVIPFTSDAPGRAPEAP